MRAGYELSLAYSCYLFRKKFHHRHLMGTYETKHSRMDQRKVFKGCLPQIFLGPFLNTLSHTCVPYFWEVARRCSKNEFSKHIQKLPKDSVSYFVEKIMSFFKSKCSLKHLQTAAADSGHQCAISKK